MFDVFMVRSKLLVAGVLLVGTACSNPGELPPEPETMSVINQSDGMSTDIAADTWCVDTWLGESCAAVDRPLIELVANCDDQMVIALPGTFNPDAGNTSTKVPPGMGEAWTVDVREGTVVVRADGSGRWNRASWTFELIREVEGC